MTNKKLLRSTPDYVVLHSFGRASGSASDSPSYIPVQALIFVDLMRVLVSLDTCYVQLACPEGLQRFSREL